MIHYFFESVLFHLCSLVYWYVHNLKIINQSNNYCVVWSIMSENYYSDLTQSGCVPSLRRIYVSMSLILEHKWVYLKVWEPLGDRTKYNHNQVWYNVVFFPLCLAMSNSHQLPYNPFVPQLSFRIITKYVAKALMKGTHLNGLQRMLNRRHCNRGPSGTL